MSQRGKALFAPFAFALVVELALERLLLAEDAIAAVITGELLVPAGVVLLYAARLTLLILLLLMTHRFAARGVGLPRA